MGIVNNLLRWKTERVAPEQPKRSVPPGPATPLMLLLPDAGRIASYQLNVFPSAKAAEFYLESALRGKVPEGAVLFWALSSEPASHPDYTPAEPIVVIRDTREATVYPFSFSDIASAMEFIRYEMKRGLELAQVTVLFAVPARIEVDFSGHSTIIPPAAPARRLQPTRVDTVQAVPISRAPKPMTRVAIPAPQPARPSQPDLLDYDARYLNESDIADVVQTVRDITREAPVADQRVLPMPRRSAVTTTGSRVSTDAAPALAPIEFTPAAQKVQEARATQAMITSWSNFSKAVDEALDVYVAHQVSAKLVWNRLCRAFREALAARQRLRMLAAWQVLTVAFADAAETMGKHSAHPEQTATAQARPGDGASFKPLDEDHVETEPRSGTLGLCRPGSRRWEPRAEPFGGFNSPVGRFRSREPKDVTGA